MAHIYLMIENQSLLAAAWTALKTAVRSLPPVDVTQPAYLIHGTDKSSAAAQFEGYFSDDDMTAAAWEARLSAIIGAPVVSESRAVMLSESESTLIRLISGGVVQARIYLFSGGIAQSRHEAVAAMAASTMPGSGRDHFISDLADLPALAAGDTVYLQRGVTYRGTLIVEAGGVTVAAYGDGPDPFFDLSVSYAAGWADVGGGVWSHDHVPANPSTYEGVWFANYGYAMSESLEHTQSNRGAFFYDTTGDTLFVNLRDGDTLADLRIRYYDAAVKLRAPDCAISGVEAAYGVDGLTASALASRPSFSGCGVHHCSYYGIESAAADTSIINCTIDYCGMNRGGGAITINGATAVRGRVTDSAMHYNGGHPLFFVNGTDARNWGSGPQFAVGAHYGYVAGNTIVACAPGCALSIGINSESSGYHVVENNTCSGGHSSCVSLNNAPGCQIFGNTLSGYYPPQHITRVGNGVMILTGSTGCVVEGNTVFTYESPGVSAFSPIYTVEDMLSCDDNLYWQPLQPERIGLYKSAWKTWTQWRALGYDANSLPPSDPESLSDGRLTAVGHIFSGRGDAAAYP